MRTFLGVFMALIVSGYMEHANKLLLLSSLSCEADGKQLTFSHLGVGETTVPITAILGDSVLLPCICAQRNLDEDFRWQMDEPNVKPVLKYNSTGFYDRSEGRAQIFLPEDRKNCSVLLTNITVDDRGKYRCRFYSEGQYRRFFVNLNISVNYCVSQKPSPRNQNGDSVFKCDAHGRYKGAEIQWSLDGRPLKNSSTTHITHTNTGHYHLTSNLTIKLNGTSEPSCNVTAKDISPVIRYDCEGTTGYRRQDDLMRCHYSIIVPILLVLGFSGFLGCRWKLSQREVRTDIV